MKLSYDKRKVFLQCFWRLNSFAIWLLLVLPKFISENPRRILITIKIVKFTSFSKWPNYGQFCPETFLFNKKHTRVVFRAEGAIYEKGLQLNALMLMLLLFLFLLFLFLLLLLLFVCRQDISKRIAPIFMKICGSVGHRLRTNLFVEFGRTLAENFIKRCLLLLRVGEIN